MSTVIISATNRPNSYTLQVSRYIQALCSTMHLTTLLVNLEDYSDELGQKGIYQKSTFPKNLLQLQEDVLMKAEKFIFVIPEYNGSFPGILKLFIDAMTISNSKASFAYKKVAMVGVSDGRMGNLRGIDHFMSITRYLKMYNFPVAVNMPQIDDNWENNEPNEEIRERLINLLREFNAF